MNAIFSSSSQYLCLVVRKLKYWQWINLPAETSTKLLNDLLEFGFKELVFCWIKNHFFHVGRCNLIRNSTPSTKNVEDSHVISTKSSRSVFIDITNDFDFFEVPWIWIIFELNIFIPVNERLLYYNKNVLVSSELPHMSASIAQNIWIIWILVHFITIALYTRDLTEYLR